MKRSNRIHPSALIDQVISIGLVTLAVGSIVVGTAAMAQSRLDTPKPFKPVMATCTTDTDCEDQELDNATDEVEDGELMAVNQAERDG